MLDVEVVHPVTRQAGARRVGGYGNTGNQWTIGELASVGEIAPQGPPAYGQVDIV